ncbi:MAG: prepilin-type N-terminal cleavage/methylation domain-containing protein [Planctomycetes bacterium]|nr:prepilin-type N-terminal cleavage/methylation domain-containing protein [Planctomycetota bacterium]
MPYTRPFRTAAAAPGFTLLEVLVSVAILAVSIVTLLIIRNNSVKEAAQTHTIAIAAVLAREKIGELESVDIEEAGDGGDFGDVGFPEYRWIKEVVLEEVSTDGESTTGSAPAAATPGSTAAATPTEIYKTTLTVFYPAEPEEKKVVVVSYRLKKEDETPKEQAGGGSAGGGGGGGGAPSGGGGGGAPSGGGGAGS